MKIFNHLLLLCFVTLIQYAYSKDKDLYKILGVKRDASANEIKHKFRQLSRQYHPDKNKKEGAKEKYTEINEAYEILSNNKKRRLYDRGGMDLVNRQAQMEQNGNAGDFDFFGNFFGGRRQRDNSVEELKLKIRASLQDLYLGKEYEFTYTRNTICPHCRGSGADSDDDVKTCDQCGGKGMIIETKQLGPGFIQQFQRTCPKCGGKGKIVSKECHVCHGEKIVKGLEEMTLVIEKGMEDGARIVNY